MSETVSGLNASGSDGSGVDWQSFDSEGFLRRLVDELGLSVAEIEFGARRFAFDESARWMFDVLRGIDEFYERARLAGRFDEDDEDD